MRAFGTSSGLRLTPSDLAKILAILEKIDRREIEPRLPDRLGQFLRQCIGGRQQVDDVLAKRRLKRRADGPLSGNTLGTVTIQPMLQTQVSILEFPLGETADTLAIAEELGCLTHIRMWLKSPIANAAYNILKANLGLRLSGDFRWSPPSRMTTGEAELAPTSSKLNWHDARCLKAVADDLIRPPHALEYVLDYRLGQPSLKYFRCVCAMRERETWEVLPAFEKKRSLEVAGGLAQNLSSLGETRLAALLIYREPWSRAWTIANAVAIDAEDALAHVITWADFQCELEGVAIDGSAIRGITDTLRAVGLRVANVQKANLTRALLPVARDLLRSIRRLG